MDEQDRLRLLAFFEARLEDEVSAAEAATPGPWWYNPGKQWLNAKAFERYDLAQGEEFVGYGGPHPFTGAVAATGPANNPQSMADAAFIARHHPTRALAEINAKRALVKLYRLARRHQAGGSRGRLPGRHQAPCFQLWGPSRLRLEVEPLTALVSRPSAELSTDRHDPRDDWHDEAKNLRARLEELYGEQDPLPTAAGAWVTRQKSTHTRRAYARNFLRWEAYARSSGIHPLQAKLPLADAYANHLAKQPGRGGGTLSDSARAQALSAAGSFYDYAVRIEAIPASPFSHVDRPRIDADHSPTQGLADGEVEKLITTALNWAPRSYALVALLYLLGARIDEILALDVTDLGYDRGHRTLPLRLKGNKRKVVPVPPLALDALERHLNGREEGPLFTTESGRRWSQPEVWKHLRVLARAAGIPQAASIKPHTLRHQFITDNLAEGVPLERVQDAVGHSDPRTTQRYNRRRRALDDHPAYGLAARLAERMQFERGDE